MANLPTSIKNLNTLLGEQLTEGGGGGGGGVEPLIVNFTDDFDGYKNFDKTWKEVTDAYIAGTPVLCKYPEDEYVTKQYCSIIACGAFDGTYKVTVVDSGSLYEYETDSENGYPRYNFGD
jgi:hypothetical protein